jgi:hypothetical protein
MADFVGCADDRDVIKLITWLRCPLDEAQLHGAQALYLKQMAAVSPAFIDVVCQLLQRFHVQRLELHSNHHHARNGVLPLLRSVLARRLLAPGQIALELYDDGRLSVRHRGELAALPDLGQALVDGAEALRATVFDGAPTVWSLATSYSWHRFFETRYHMLWPELYLSEGSSTGWDDGLKAAARPMRFDHAHALGPARWSRYLAYFGLQAAQRQALRAFASDPESFVFVGMSVWDAQENRRRLHLQLDTIAALRERGLLDFGRLGFKGHPANLDGEASLRTALGDNVQPVPARLPLEVMMMDGLLPAAFGGVISTAYLNLPPERLRFMICNAASPSECLAQPDVQVMLKLGMITPDRVHPWLTPARVEAAEPA